MDLDEFKNMSNDPDLIPGIHNYCDRWCERCHLSSRCMVFKMESMEKAESESQAASGEDFWSELSDMFAVTFEVLQELAEEKGIDLDAVDDKIDNAKNYGKEEIEKHLVTKAANQYFKAAREWLDDSREFFQEEREQFTQLADLNISTQNGSNNLLALFDLRDIINWYHTMIPVKTKRAVSGLFNNYETEEIQNDMNGTAKVVLICVERSMFAWNGLFKYLDDHEDKILNNLVLLQRLKQRLEQHFPNAKKFIRPGFDE